MTVGFTPNVINGIIFDYSIPHGTFNAHKMVLVPW